MFCLGSIAWCQRNCPQVQCAQSQRANGTHPLSFLVLKDHDLILSVVKCLKTVAAYILSSFILVDGRKVSLVPITTSWPEVEVKAYTSNFKVRRNLGGTSEQQLWQQLTAAAIQLCGLPSRVWSLSLLLVAQSCKNWSVPLGWGWCIQPSGRVSSSFTTIWGRKKVSFGQLI